MTQRQNALPKIVLLGIGNILLGDEGVGVHVIKELERSFSFPSNVELIDGGTAGFDLLPVIESADHLIVIDCVHSNCEPGTIFRIIPEVGAPTIFQEISLHQISLIQILTLAKFNQKCPQTVIFGIQSAEEEININLSSTIESNLKKIINLILDELSNLGIIHLISAERS
ncbi:MAG: HyaD/HybD family hydrogenase maturation endopeptidase [Desulfobacterales bacterium]|nr:HyaD/HybD family hydrogenase maturation endopeptidase [Desulfobacterales bacterium]